MKNDYYIYWLYIITQKEPSWPFQFPTMIKLHYINQQCIGYSMGEFYQLTVYDFLLKSVER